LPFVPSKATKTTCLFIRVEPQLARMIDAFVNVEKRRNRGVALSRADVVRKILWEHLAKPDAATTEKDTP
jgi:hypothetical protein